MATRLQHTKNNDGPTHTAPSPVIPKTRQQSKDERWWKAVENTETIKQLINAFIAEFMSLITATTTDLRNGRVFHATNFNIETTEPAEGSDLLILASSSGDVDIWRRVAAPNPPTATDTLKKSPAGNWFLRIFTTASITEFSTQFAAQLAAEIADRIASVIALEGRLSGPQSVIIDGDVTWTEFGRGNKALAGYTATGRRVKLDDWTIGNIAMRLNLDGNGALSTSQIQINGFNGQSLSVGGNYSPALSRSMLSNFEGRDCLQISGLKRGDGISLTDTLGPRSRGYDQTAHGFGFENAQPGPMTIGMAFPAYALLNDYRADLGLPQIPIVTSVHGIAGVQIEEMDDDPSTGGVTDTIVWDNFTYWHLEAKSLADSAGLKVVPGWHLIDHGTSAARMPRYAYSDQWWKLQKKSEAFLSNLGIPIPLYCVTIPSGNTNTAKVNKRWNVIDDLLDICEQGGAVLGTCQHWYPIADNNVHPDAYSTALASETLAWCMSEIEVGHRWTINRPRIANNGASLTLHFDSLREDETLALEDAAKYGGEGIDQWAGFELAGGTITGLTLRGHTVVITYTGTPTQLRYARQVQDVTGFAGNQYTSFRGMLRTSLQKPSKIIPGEILSRPIPPLKMEL